MIKTTLYDGAVEITFNPKGHKYSVNDQINNLYGYTPLGVSTISKVCANTDWMIPWAAKVCAEKVVELLKDKFFVRYLKIHQDHPHYEPYVAMDELDEKELIDLIKIAPRTFSDRAATIGTMVHQFAEDYATGKHPQYPRNKQARTGCEAFLDWWNQNKVKPIQCEKIIYSRRFKYAGTLDLECEIDGSLALLDYKTGSMFKPEWPIQLAGYEQARYEETGVEYRRFCLRFDKETGEFEQKEYTFDSDWPTFYHCLGVLRNGDL